jgi:hypothetical protein
MASGLHLDSEGPFQVRHDGFRIFWLKLVHGQDRVVPPAGVNFIKTVSAEIYE